MFVRSGVAVLGVLAAVTISPGVAFADGDGSSGADTASQSTGTSSDTQTGSGERDGGDADTTGADVTTTTDVDAAGTAGDEADVAEEVTDDLSADGTVDDEETDLVEPVGEPVAETVADAPAEQPVADESASEGSVADESVADGGGDTVTTDRREGTGATDRGGDTVTPDPADAPAPKTEFAAGSAAEPETEPTGEAEPERTLGGDLASPTQPTLVPASDATAETGESTSTALATMTAAAASSTAEAVRPSPLELIGSWLFSALAGLVRLFDPKPSIPAGSLVTRQTSKLEVGCGCGETLDADWYFPNQAEEPAGLIYLQHGFFRSKANVSALAVQLAEQTNSVVVVPTVASDPFAQGGCWVNGDAMHRAVADLFVGDMTALTASATAAAGHAVILPAQFVLAGQSAGGNLAASAAAFSVDNGAIDRLRAVVMFDGVDNGGRIAAGSAALTGVNARPVFQIAAECALCNVFGAGTSALVDSRPDGFVGVRLEGGKHTDAEGASSGLIGMLTCGVPDSANVAAVPVIAAGWINDVFTGSQDGLYGAGGERFHVGAATAVVLGTGSGLARASAPVHVGWSEY
ncbi:hypothetical protein ACEWX3_21730 [Mycobacterium sp. G7A2]|uniref:hypothetical protein n=1 Tax=Mycobacterium sp. G7A2 TaxID=3317307 RepID=UPI0035A846D7